MNTDTRHVEKNIVAYLLRRGIKNTIMVVLDA